MFKSFLTAYQLHFNMAVNRWIYFLQKIPVVKYLFPDSLYHTAGIKRILTKIMFVFAIFSQLFKKGFYIFVLTFPVMYFVKDPTLRLSAWMQLFIFFSVIAGTISNLRLFQTDETRWLLLKVMRFNRSLYIRSDVFSHYIIYAIFMLIGVIGSVTSLGGNVIQAISLVVLAIGTQMLMDIFQMVYFKKKHTLPLLAHSSYVIVAAFISMGIGVGLLLSGVVLPLEKGIYVGYIMLLVILYVSYAIMHYTYFDEASNVSIQIYSNLMSSIGDGNSASFQDVVIRDKDIQDIKQDKKLFRDKTGYDYLNAIFFHRQKRIFYRPIRNRIIWITLIVGGAVLIKIISQIDLKAVSLMGLLPSMVFVMYGINVGSRATRSLFYNCDVSLLEYSFYRRKEAVLKNFMIRLKYIIGYNLIPSILLCIYIPIALMMIQFSFTAYEIMLFVVTILLLSVLFSVHYLFVYYVFQPYSRDYNLKNPFFSIINSIMYVICFTTMRVQNANIYFVVGILVFTILYIIIALVSVYRYAPKTFRIR